MTPEPKLCVECRWRFQETCRSPKNYRETINLVTGNRRFKYIGYEFCESHRLGLAGNNEFDCGEEGRFWEPIPDDQLNGAEHGGTTEPERKDGGKFLKGI